MKRSNKEAVHLCPICVCVEMEFIERLKTEKHYRIRRFKCPVCNHSEMYIMGGPDDEEKSYQFRVSAKTLKIKDQLQNEYKS